MVPTCVAVAGGSGGSHVCGSGRRCGGGAPRVWQWKAVLVVPTCVAVAGGGGCAHVCGGGRRWWWCPCVWQWQAVVVVPTCVAVEGGVVVVPTCVAVEGGGCGGHVRGSGRRCGGGAHMCGSGRRCGWWCPRVWQWKAVAVVPMCVAVEGGGGDADVCGSRVVVW